MNLKEAFHFQNSLRSLLIAGIQVLENPRNTTKTENHYLKHKVVPTEEDEVFSVEPNTEYSEYITEMAGFVMYLLQERTKLAAAIREAKGKLPISVDDEVSLNNLRRKLVVDVFEPMCKLRNSETIRHNDGDCYRFNQEGNQITYYCDVKQVTTINFDRKKVQGYLNDLKKLANETSAQIDLALVTTKVDYEPAFNVNATFEEAFEDFAHIQRE